MHGSWPGRIGTDTYTRLDWKSVNDDGDPINPNILTQDGESENYYQGYRGSVNAFYDVNAYNSFNSSFKFGGRTMPVKNNNSVVKIKNNNTTNNNRVNSTKITNTIKTNSNNISNNTTKNTTKTNTTNKNTTTKSNSRTKTNRSYNKSNKSTSTPNRSYNSGSRNNSSGGSRNSGGGGGGRSVKPRK